MWISVPCNTTVYDRGRAVVRMGITRLYRPGDQEQQISPEGYESTSQR
jgi:hypothetical protein